MQIQLSWTALASSADGGDPISSYAIYGKVDGASTYTLVYTDTTNAGTTTLTSVSTTISEGTLYDFIYEACNSYGCSGDSPMVQILAADSPT